MRRSVAPESLTADDRDFVLLVGGPQTLKIETLGTRVVAAAKSFGEGATG